LSIWTIKSGFDINSCPIARGKWNASSGKWKRHPTCPIGQAKMILWYVQLLKSKMINIELFSVGSRDEFYLNIASYVSCILRHFVLFCWLRNSPFSNKDCVIYISQLGGCAASTSYLFSPANEKLELFAVYLFYKIISDVFPDIKLEGPAIFGNFLQ
jgi:hypothetical protein